MTQSPASDDDSALEPRGQVDTVREDYQPGRDDTELSGLAMRQEPLKQSKGQWPRTIHDRGFRFGNIAIFKPQHDFSDSVQELRCKETASKLSGLKMPPCSNFKTVGQHSDYVEKQQSGRRELTAALSGLEMRQDSNRKTTTTEHPERMKSSQEYGRGRRDDEGFRFGNVARSRPEDGSVREGCWS